MTTNTIDYTSCPACSGRRFDTLSRLVKACRRCGAVVGTCYRGDAYRWAKIGTLGSGDAHRYFDLTLLGSDGVERVHGWVDQAGTVVQYG